MQKPKILKFLKKVLLLILFGFILFGIGYLAAIGLSHILSFSLQDLLFLEGMLVLIIGIIMTMKGNPTSIGIGAYDKSSVAYRSFENLEVTRLEREATEHNKNFLKNSIVEFAFNSLVLILGGILLIACSALLLL